LHNIVKHAKARHVVVALRNGAAGLELEIRDDGIGFDPKGEFAGHLGLRSMRERAAKAGASLTIDSAGGRGTTVLLHVPSRAMDLTSPAKV
jgi:signal transduction histidine kinase